VRILVASHYALPHVGGIEVAIDALARELSARGHRVVHLACDATVEHGEAALDRPYEVVTVPAINLPEQRLGVPWPVFGPQLLPVLRRHVRAADVVHAHGLLYASSVLALVMARRLDRARVLTEHVGQVPYESPVLDRVQSLAIASVGRAAVRRSQAVVVLNDKVRDEVRALHPPSRIVQIPNGVDAETYRPPEPNERDVIRASLGWDDRPRVLFVGRLVAKKGVGLALQAAAVAGGEWELVVAGPGRPLQEIPEHVSLLGPQRPARIAELYRAADALLMPSRGEGFPITVQEAMASGLPVVLLDDPSYAPYLRGAGHGARVAPPDADAIAAALSDLVADPGARAAAGAQARTHAQRAYSWPRAADAHEALYASL
jgi:glycosyltransferase involved in cell wall biosynthesis